MNTQTAQNGLAPTAGSYRLGGKGGRMAVAWQHIWNQLDSTYRDATELAAGAAEITGLKPVSIVSHLHRMAKDGHIVGEVRDVTVEVTRNGRSFPATRKRTFYRLPA